MQRKYLLESYNEHKHKPDNSILRVKVILRQTSGDVLFKALVSLNYLTNVHFIRVVSPFTAPAHQSGRLVNLSRMRVFKQTYSPHDVSATPMFVYPLPVTSVESALVSWCSLTATDNVMTMFCAGSGSGNLHAGSSLQDVHCHATQPPTSEAKSSSACSLHSHSSDSGIAIAMDMLLITQCPPSLMHQCRLL